ncbi:MAG TPA: ParB N-terminal domain-containing protein [Actinospica sp.]|jgi:ParB/RepB/Spo0J family partition protein|nr:ParB N-terminal domain-containing protein [Actinospica sp.]
MSIAMPEHDQAAPDAALVAEIDAIGQEAEDGAGSPSPQEPTETPMIELRHLVRNPKNPRSPKRRKPRPDLLTSVKDRGFDTPFVITRTDRPGKYMIMDGHLRMDVAEHLKLEKVPYSFKGALADDPAEQYLITVTTSQHKEPLTPLQTASMLFGAAEAGASKEQLAAAYGKKRGRVEEVLKVGKLPKATRSAAEACSYEWDIAELAVLDEFADDQEATERLMQAAEANRFKFQVERERIEREEREQRAAIRAEHEAAGVTVLDEEPDGAVRVTYLQDRTDGSCVTEEAHAVCPGHAAVFERYGRVRVSYFCLDPEANGHEVYSPRGSASTPKVVDKAAKRAVVRGNKDHAAAQTVRQTWLRGLISGAGSLEKDTLDKISRFATLASLNAPDPVRKFTSAMKRAELQADLLGMGASKPEDFEQAVISASPRRLMMLNFAVVAAAYEKAVTKDTWRTDQAQSAYDYSGSDRKHARVWLKFCREVGHNLAPIEAAIVADETYTPADLSGSQAGTLTGAQDGKDEKKDGQDAQDGAGGGDESAKDEDDPRGEDGRDGGEPDEDEADGNDLRDEDEPNSPAGAQVEESEAA